LHWPIFYIEGKVWKNNCHSMLLYVVIRGRGPKFRGCSDLEQDFETKYRLSCNLDPRRPKSLKLLDSIMNVNTIYPCLGSSRQGQQ
jgi:hypothetical protein